MLSEWNSTQSVCECASGQPVTSCVRVRAHKHTCVPARILEVLVGPVATCRAKVVAVGILVVLHSQGLSTLVESGRTKVQQRTAHARPAAARLTQIHLEPSFSPESATATGKSSRRDQLRQPPVYLYSLYPLPSQPCQPPHCSVFPTGSDSRFPLR